MALFGRGNGDSAGQSETPGEPGPGVSTGQIGVGRFILDVGRPEGTLAVLAPTGSRTDSTELAAALDARPPATAVEAEGALESAEAVTAKVERSLELFTALAQGRFLDRGMLTKELDALLDTLERLDRSGRFEDALRLARALEGVLALALRWAGLVQSLRIAVRAAQALVDQHGHAWALHELGTLAMARTTPTRRTATFRSRSACGERSETRRGRQRPSGTCPSFAPA